MSFYQRKKKLFLYRSQQWTICLCIFMTWRGVDFVWGLNKLFPRKRRQHIKNLKKNFTFIYQRQRIYVSMWAFAHRYHFLSPVHVLVCVCVCASFKWRYVLFCSLLSISVFLHMWTFIHSSFFFLLICSLTLGSSSH